MDTADDDDTHLCLVCHTTIKGIINYVTHKKNECVGKRVVKGELPQTLSTQSTITTEALNNVSTPYIPQSTPYIPQKYSHSQPFETDFTQFRSAVSSHRDIIDFETGQFNPANDDRDSKPCLANILYSGSHDKTPNLFEPQGTAARMDVPNSQKYLDIPIPTSLNLSPSIFRPEHSSEDHGLLDGCITSDHLEPGFSTGMEYPVLSSNTVQTTNSSSLIMSDIIANTSNKEEDNQNRNASEKVDDFFQSLELMSKNDPRAEKGAAFGQPLANLPISNILSNLTFSSDEEEFSFDFADDVSFDSLSDDSDIGLNKITTVQSSMSGSVKSRPRFRGKWPPGQGPEVTTPRQHQKTSKGGKKFPPETFKKNVISPGKLKQHSQIKPFSCSICELAFGCRFKYSNHFGTAEHKQNLQKRRSERMETRRPFKRGRGKSFKLIREVNKQFENDPFSQPFTSEKTDPLDRDGEPMNQITDVITDGKVTEEPLNDISVENKKDETRENHQNEMQDVVVKVNSYAENKGSTINEEDKTHCVESNNDKVIQDNQMSEQNPPGDTEPMYQAVPMYICTICDRKYPNKYYISRHMMTNSHRKKAQAHPEEAFDLLQLYHKYIIRLSPYQCAICRFYFNNYEEFLKHLESVDHAETQDNLVAEMMCSLCMFRTHYNEDLLEHVRTEEHVNNIRKKRKICIIKESHIKCKCKYCGLVMNSYTRLKRHVVLKHKDKQFVSGVVKKQIGVRNRPKCSICFQQFACQSTLDLHVIRRHRKERPYKCHMCRKGFSDKHAFKGHLRTSRHLNKILKSNEVKKESNRTNEEKEKPLQVDGSLFKISDVRTENKKDHDELIVNSENTADSIDLKADLNIKKEKSDFILIPTSVESYDTNEDKNMQIQSSSMKWTPTIKPIKINLKSSQIINPTEKKTKRKRQKLKGAVIIKDKTYKCNHCSFTVTTYNDLRPHYLKEHAAQTIICELCDIVFLSDKAMKLHILSKEHQQNISASNQTQENETKYYECHVCKKKFTDEKYCNFHTAYQHFHITTEEGVIKEYGEKSITREKYKQVLADIESLRYTARIECPECKVKFKKPNFLEHLRIHTGEKPFKCKMCPKAFMANVTLRKHLLGHFGCQERTCEVCNKHFKKASSYEEHRQVHEAEKASTEKMHVCDTCGLSFYLARQLQTHIRRHKEKEFKCTVPGCHWKFLFANELKYHMRSHSQQKPFLCDICGYSATSKCRLTRHHKTHTGERNYHCEYCSYKAGNGTHLHRHMRIHIGSKPFKCPYCDYTCNTHENMRKHIVQTKKHVGLKIYPCKFCDYATNSCADFRNHLIENHENDLGPDIKMKNGLSKFTGLYHKELDPKQPMEGNKIHQAKERIPRVKKSADDSSGKARKKDKSKGKGAKAAKPSNSTTADVMDANRHTGEIPAAHVAVEEESVKHNNLDIDHLMEMKPSFESIKSGNGRHQGKSNMNPSQDMFNVQAHFERQRQYVVNGPGKLEGKDDTTDTRNNNNCSAQIGGYENTSARDLTFGQAYAIYSTDNIQKQALTSINAPINYRSLLKPNTSTYHGYSAYSDHQQLPGTSPQDYNRPYEGNQVLVLPGNRGEPGGMMAENLHRNAGSAAPFSYIVKRLGQNQEEGEQHRAGNLVIDLDYEKKHLHH